MAGSGARWMAGVGLVAGAMLGLAARRAGAPAPGEADGAAGLARAGFGELAVCRAAGGSAVAPDAGGAAADERVAPDAGGAAAAPDAGGAAPDELEVPDAGRAPRWPDDPAE